MPYRNHLGHLMVGIKKTLPGCERLLSDAATSSAMERSKLGRQDVEIELERIDAELCKLRGDQ